jgi:hypothetical protein
MVKGAEFAPGNSPFHVKGSVWHGIREYVDERVAGGLGAVSARLDAAHQAFFAGTFTNSGWYDLLPVVRVSQAIARAMGLDIAEYMRVSAMWHAERDMKGAFAPVLRSDAPEAVCRRYASIHALLYDFGRAEVVGEEPRRVHACAYGLPEPIAGWWMRASESYLDPVLRAAGAREPRLAWRPIEADGEQFGVPLVRVASTTSWE